MFSLILSVSLAQAPCPNGQCPRVQAAVQTVSSAVQIVAPAAPTLTLKPRESHKLERVPGQPLRNLVRAVVNIGR